MEYNYICIVPDETWLSTSDEVMDVTGSYFYSRRTAGNAKSGAYKASEQAKLWSVLSSIDPHSANIWRNLNVLHWVKQHSHDGKSYTIYSMEFVFVIEPRHRYSIEISPYSEEYTVMHFDFVVYTFQKSRLKCLLCHLPSPDVLFIHVMGYKMWQNRVIHHNFNLMCSW